MRIIDAAAVRAHARHTVAGRAPNALLVLACSLAHLGHAPFAPSFSPSSYSPISATLYSSSSFSPSPYSSYSLGARSQVYITPPTTRWRPLAEARTPNPRRYGYVARI